MADSGIAALGIDLKAFVFQLINFLILLLVLRRFAYPYIVRALEDRKRKIDEQLQNAAELERKLALAHKKSLQIIDESHKKAQDIMSDASTRANALIQEAVKRAEEETESIALAAQVKLEEDVRKARIALKKETASLVAAATEKVIGEKMTDDADLALIERALV